MQAKIKTKVTEEVAAFRFGLLDCDVSFSVVSGKSRTTSVVVTPGLKKEEENIEELWKEEAARAFISRPGVCRFV